MKICPNARMSCPICIEYKDPTLFTCPIHGKYDPTRHPSNGCHFCIDNGIEVVVKVSEKTSTPVEKESEKAPKSPEEIVSTTIDFIIENGKRNAEQYMAEALEDLDLLENLRTKGYATDNQTSRKESDPNGIKPNEPGAKLDAGKVRVGMMLDQFAHALWAVAEVCTYGATKYSEGGWLEVPDGEARYSDAEGRHRLKKRMGEEYDPASGLRHMAHFAWNALAQLELKLRREEKK